MELHPSLPAWHAMRPEDGIAGAAAALQARQIGQALGLEIREPQRLQSASPLYVSRSATSPLLGATEDPELGYASFQALGLELGPSWSRPRRGHMRCASAPMPSMHLFRGSGGGGLEVGGCAASASLSRSSMCSSPPMREATIEENDAEDDISPVVIDDPKASMLEPLMLHRSYSPTSMRDYLGSPAHVQVRNTFIEVPEGDAESVETPPAGRRIPRRNHLRTASAPVWTMPIRVEPTTLESRASVGFAATQGEQAPRSVPLAMDSPAAVIEESSEEQSVASPREVRGESGHAALPVSAASPSPGGFDWSSAEATYLSDSLHLRDADRGYSNIHVRNTFIEVKEAGEPGDGSPSFRLRSHQRMKSEPVCCRYTLGDARASDEGASLGFCMNDWEASSSLGNRPNRGDVGSETQLLRHAVLQPRRQSSTINEDDLEGEIESVCSRASASGQRRCASLPLVGEIAAESQVGEAPDGVTVEEAAAPKSDAIAPVVPPARVAAHLPQGPKVPHPPQLARNGFASGVAPGPGPQQQHQNQRVQAGLVNWGSGLLRLAPPQYAPAQLNGKAHTARPLPEGLVASGPLLPNAVLAASATLAATAAANPVLCKWFARGTCKYGADCRYTHARSNETGAGAIVAATADRGVTAVAVPPEKRPKGMLTPGLVVPQTPPREQPGAGRAKAASPDVRPGGRKERRRQQRESGKSGDPHSGSLEASSLNGGSGGSPKLASPQGGSSSRSTIAIASESPGSGGAKSPKQLRAGRQRLSAGSPGPAGPPAPLGKAPRQRSPDSGSPSSEDEHSDDQVAGAEGGGAFYQVIWCDQRGFKSESASLREQLAVATGVSPKTHKTAEKCIRLLRKKCRARERRPQVRPFNIFIASWANAPALVQYLAGDVHVEAKVVVLCDTCGARVRGNAQQWSQQYASLVAGVAATWAEAVEAAACATSAFKQSQVLQLQCG